MKYIKTYEFYKTSLISVDDIIDCIKKDGLIYTNIIKNLPNHDKEEGINPIDVDNDGLITISFDGKEYEVELKNVKRIEYKD